MIDWGEKNKKPTHRSLFGSGLFYPSDGCRNCTKNKQVVIWYECPACAPHRWEKIDDETPYIHIQKKIDAVIDLINAELINVAQAAELLYAPPIRKPTEENPSVWWARDLIDRDVWHEIGQRGDGWVATIPKGSKDFHFGPTPPDSDVGASGKQDRQAHVTDVAVGGRGGAAAEQTQEPKPLYQDPKRFRGHSKGCQQWTRADYKFCSCFRTDEKRRRQWNNSTDEVIFKQGYEIVKGMIKNPDCWPHEFSDRLSEWDL